MNNLDSRCPNIVKVEIHFNNFMVDVFDEWKNHQDNADNIEDYEFTPPDVRWDERPDDEEFHRLMNGEYNEYLNKIIRNPSAFENLTAELWSNFNDLFEEWVERKWIKIIYEEEN
tara:strand:+ start:639 stop:983 length:345 start_codon:yes stop_codon:yes gene_type:complete